jgi:CHC2 zinc finger/Reverse transcriptase (RNA-dependent DNA polymerase)
LARSPIERSNQIAKIIDEGNIVDVARALGLQLDSRRRNPQRAICPFHQDKDPSLHLYHSGRGNGARDHYHCFVCGAHGDAVELIKGVEGIDFRDAVVRLAGILGVTFELGSERLAERRAGNVELVELIKNSRPDDPQFVGLAETRGFDPAWLHQAEVAPVSLQGLLEAARRNPQLRESLVLAGVARTLDESADAPELWNGGLRGFFTGLRLTFVLRDHRGDPAGFAARSLNDDKPKYLYSYAFPRKSVLYRADVILKKLQRESESATLSPVEVIVVEGIFDALRLESLGLKAVAALGNRLTDGQLAVLKTISDLCAKNRRPLTIRIFFDQDEGGRLGGYDSTLSILKLLSDADPFAVNVIWPPNRTSDKRDPDDALRGLSTTAAITFMEQGTVSPLIFLASKWLDVDPHRIAWPDVSRVKLASVARRIALALPQSSWARILAPLEVESDGGLLQLVALVRSYADLDHQAPLAASRALQALRTLKDSTDDRSDLLSALTLGRSSTTRREYPLDDASWDRLASSASTLFHLHKARLRIGDRPSSPLLARHLPKGDGRYRLKAGPVAEDAILQQYVLLELLRDRPDCPVFASRIPAIRFSRERPPSQTIYATGDGREAEALSFAYQIDMGVVNGESPPRREGVFRPYFDCWRSFIDFIESKIKTFAYDEMQILRLDITGFYDNISRGAVRSALTGPLEKALSVLGVSDGNVAAFAPMLLPDAVGSAATRAENVSDFLLHHAFGLSHFDPVTGKLKTARSTKGIPQGPDLSAYLANISLFGLDQMMSREATRINEEISSDGSRCGFAYARYVDDIVLVCQDLETASQLRRKVEANLSAQGLSLNRKNTTPPPMTRGEARAWITDNRAGFGFSGPLSDLPTTDSMDPLADAGEIDRRTALGMIFDPELDDPNKADQALKRIALALGAEDIRFNDRASAFRRLWIFAAADDHTSTGEGLAEAFGRRLSEVERDILSPVASDVRLDTALACLDGLDRALRSSVPPGILGDDAVENINRRLERISAAILDDVFSHLATFVMGRGSESVFLDRYDVRNQIAILARKSAQKIEANNPSQAISFVRLASPLAQDSLRSTKEPLSPGMLWSLHKHDANIETSGSQLLVARENASSVAFNRLYAAIVQLERLAQHGTPELEVAAPTEGADPTGILRATELILGIWSPNGEAHPTDRDEEERQVEQDAAATLVNLTHSQFSLVAANRPRLVQMVAGTSNARALPSPPGLRSSGIMLWCEDGRLLLASPAEGAVDPAGVSWVQIPQVGVEGITLKKADLPDGIEPICESDRTWSPTEIAQTYRSFFPRWSQLQPDADGPVPIPTVFSFFGPRGETNTFPDSHRLVCWTSSRATVDGHAFVRMGHALEARGVFADGADHWRFGWAIRDLCGRLEVTTDDSGGLDTHAHADLKQEAHRREAIVARVLPRLSGADNWGPGEVSPERPIPTRIERGLQLLESFGRSRSADLDAAYLVAAIAEGMFMNERVNGSERLDKCGSPASLLARATRRVTRALPEAAAHWMGADKPDLPYRRSAQAWFALAKRIEQQLTLVSESAIAPLRTLVLGTEVLGIVADLRSLSFELTAGLDHSALTGLSESKFDDRLLRDIAGSDILLVEGGSSAGARQDTEEQIQALVRAFAEIIIGRRGGLNFLRDQITPAGWVVIIGILLQVVDLYAQERGIPRPGLWPMNEVRQRLAEESLRPLLSFVSASSSGSTDSSDWPWDAFTELAAQRPKKLLDHLRQLTDAAALIVANEESWTNPRTDESTPKREVVRLADGSTISLFEWQVDIAHIRGERGSATEATEIAGRLRYAYSVTRMGDRILGLHLVSRQLARTAFGGHLDGARGGLKKDGPRLGSTSLSTVSHDSESSRDPKPSARKSDGASSVHLDRGVNSLEATSLEPSTVRAQPSSATAISASALDKVREIQRVAWKGRAAEKGSACQRIAFVQWDVTDTYNSPDYKAGILEGIILRDENGAFRAATAADIIGGGPFYSITEFRRRQILKAILTACASHDVDGLVLPEYSLRPETVNWLARQLRQAAAPKTVWCGTFRIPGGTQLDVDLTGDGLGSYLSAEFHPVPTGRSRYDFHTALMTCLRVSESKDGATIVRSFVRRKRYPSSAAGELIRPPIDEPWNPLLSEVNDPFDVGTFALELICSEIFPHASSANFIGIMEENQILARRYGLGRSVETPFKYVSRDVYEFARWTAHRNPGVLLGDVDSSLKRGKRLQRTLIVLPAMTTRSADYHIFGQNQYLAAGLVTVFCNAVEPRYGVGQSCFIGLDGWKASEPPETPYGTVAPGIFQLGKGQTGPLGKTECALVIADLDLLRTADQKPRPHYQGRPLRLVAHLPLIFETEAAEAGSNYPNGSRKLRKRVVSGVEEARTFSEAVVEIRNALDTEREWRRVEDSNFSGSSVTTDYMSAIGMTEAALKILETFADDPEWLIKRRRAFTNDRYESPTSQPLPALIDWIFVDDAWPGDQRFSAASVGEPIPALSNDLPILNVPRPTRPKPDRQPS